MEQIINSEDKNLKREEFSLIQEILKSGEKDLSQEQIEMFATMLNSEELHALEINIMAFSKDFQKQQTYYNNIMKIKYGMHEIRANKIEKILRPI